MINQCLYCSEHMHEAQKIEKKCNDLVTKYNDQIDRCNLLRNKLHKEIEECRKIEDNEKKLLREYDLLLERNMKLKN